MRIDNFDKRQNMITVILALLLFQTPPQLGEWKKITEIHYEVKNIIKTQCRDVVVTSLVGSFKIVKNPASENEFAFLVSKYVPDTFIPPSRCNTESSRDEIIVAENYFKKMREEKLKEKIEISDTILIIKWGEEVDNRTGEKMLRGSIENWLLKPNGEWIFEESKEPILKIELLSEDFGEKRILVGFKFSLGKNYHILRFDQYKLGGAQ